MTRESVTTARRFVAVLAAAALLLVGVPAAAGATAQPAASGVSAAAEATAEMSGKVLLPPGIDGVVLEDVLVRVSSYRSISETATVAADGTFRIVGLPVDEYSVRVEIASTAVYGGWLSSTSGELGRADEAIRISPRTGLQLQLAAPLTIDGLVVPPDGVAMPDVSFKKARSTDSSSQFVPVDPAGAFAASLDPHHDYVVRVGTAQGALVDGYYVGDDVSPVDDIEDATVLRDGAHVVIRPIRALVATGRVVVPDGFAGNLTRVSVTFAEPSRRLGARKHSASVRADGTFSVGGLRPNRTYRVVLADRDRELYGGYLVSSDGTVRPGKETIGVLLAAPVDVTLRPILSPRIAGEVIAPWVADEDLDGLRVDVYRADGSTASSSGLDSVRRFDIRDLEPGAAFRVCLSGLPTSTVDGCYVADEELLADPFHGAEVSPGAVLQLRPARATTMTGRVEVPVGESLDPDLGWCRVRAVGAAPDGVEPPIACGSLAADGSFELEGLDPRVGYRIELRGTESVAGGYLVDTSGRLGLGSDALEIEPRSGVVLIATVAATISATVVWPAGYDDVTAHVVVIDADGETAGEGWPGTGVVVAGLDANQDYTVRLEGTSSIWPAVGGYYASDTTVGLVPEDRARAVPAGSSIVLRPRVEVDLVVDLRAPALGAGWDLTTVTAVLEEREPGTTTWREVSRKRFGWMYDHVSLDAQLPTRGYRIRLEDSSDQFTAGYLVGRDGELGPVENARVLTSAGTVDAQLQASPARTIRNLEAPRLVGPLSVGSRATVQPGRWSHAGVSLTYRWFRDGTLLSWVRGPHYTPVEKDAGAALSVEVVASGTQLYPAKAMAGRARVALLQMSVITPPAVLGTTQVGAFLRARPATWSALPTDRRYQWLRNGVAISGATSVTYTVRAGDAGARLSVRETALRPGYETARAVSARTSLVRPSTT